ncbi:hypothetical protein SAMN02745124_01311 [Desulfofustis glycolicus DSM 9705]|uniref:Uncharacterized protein n=1 Tax=Desulfofustis glycolicus DSM 9705 TaxID=1121409 RepID=A0A1M5UTR6_9BACT|nr:hypothetical protein SAMN02745124_01311 [Desulfofustis glycolicus DSM 9705]
MLPARLSMRRAENNTDCERFYIKIGGTGFNLSPADFKKPTGPSDQEPIFIVCCDVPSWGV